MRIQKDQEVHDLQGLPMDSKTQDGNLTSTNTVEYWSKINKKNKKTKT